MKSSFAIVDLKEPNANRDHDGGFGSRMHATGFAGKLISHLKSNLVKIPITDVGNILAILREANYSVSFYDTVTQGEDIILIASSLHCYKEELAFAKEQKAKYPNSRIGFFGPLCKTHPELFADIADFIIMGEIEKTLLLFTQDELELKGQLDNGILSDITQLPTPDWDGVNINDFNYFPLLHRKPLLTMQTSRGCSFNCDYCPYMVSQTKEYRSKNATKIVDDIENLIDKYGIKSLLFRDLVFTFNKKLVREICHELIARKVIIDWACETRVDLLDEALIDLMVKAGFKGVNLGIESNNIEILMKSGKQSQPISQQQRMIDYLHNKKVKVNVFYILGLIDDTPESIKSNIKFSRNLNTIGAQFTLYTPYPGTPTFEKHQERLLTNDLTKYNQFEPVLRLDHISSKELMKFRDNAYNYYFRWKWLKSYSSRVTYELLFNLSVTLKNWITSRLRFLRHLRVTKS